MSMETICLIDAIITDKKLQMRKKLDGPTIERYAEMLSHWMEDDDPEAPCPLPKIELADLDGDLYLIDGWHRFEAIKQVLTTYKSKDGRTILTGMEVTAVDSYMEMIRLAAQANSKHGLPLSSAEKRRAVEAWVNTELSSDEDALSVREVARLLGVSHALVGKIRNERNPKKPSKKNVETVDSTAAGDEEDLFSESATTGRTPASAAADNAPRVDTPTANGADPEITHPTVPAAEKPAADIEAEDREAAKQHEKVASQQLGERARQLLKRWNASEPMVCTPTAAAIALALGVDSGTRLLTSESDPLQELTAVANEAVVEYLRDIEFFGADEAAKQNLDYLEARIPDHNALEV